MPTFCQLKDLAHFLRKAIGGKMKSTPVFSITITPLASSYFSAR